MDKYIHIPGIYNNQIACQPLNAYGHEKVAEEKSTKLDPKVIDLVKKITPNPDKHIFILLTALGAGEIWGGNSNADFFFEKDLNSEDSSFGYKTFTNAGHRLFGVKNVVTFAMPGGIKYEEKGVSGKTGMETVTYGYVGYKVWTPKAGLIVDITLA